MRIQNQTGNHPNKWDKTGVVIEVRQFHQYVVKVDGSGRISIRNRKFLRKYNPVHEREPKRSILDDLKYLKPNYEPEEHTTPPPTNRPTQILEHTPPIAPVEQPRPTQIPEITRPTTPIDHPATNPTTTQDQQQPSTQPPISPLQPPLSPDTSTTDSPPTSNTPQPATIKPRRSSRIKRRPSWHTSGEFDMT